MKLELTVCTAASRGSVETRLNSPLEKENKCRAAVVERSTRFKQQHYKTGKERKERKARPHAGILYSTGKLGRLQQHHDPDVDWSNLPRPGLCHRCLRSPTSEPPAASATSPRRAHIHSCGFASQGAHPQLWPCLRLSFCRGHLLSRRR